MADNKKYYYLKLKENFFDSDEMVILESMQEGYKYSNILLKLYLRSLKNNGKLILNEKIPFSSSMLSSLTRHSVGDIEKSIKIFENLGLIEILDNGAIYLLAIENFVGRSSTEADRKRISRSKIHEEKRTIGQMSDKHPPELEIELEIKIKEYVSELQNIFKSYYSNISIRFNKKQVTNKLKLKLKTHDFEKIKNGFINYLDYNKKAGHSIQYVKSVHSFIQNEMYLDYQEALENVQRSDGIKVINSSVAAYATEDPEPMDPRKLELFKKMLRSKDGLTDEEEEELDKDTIITK